MQNDNWAVTTKNKKRVTIKNIPCTELEDLALLRLRLVVQAHVVYVNKPYFGPRCTMFNPFLKLNDRQLLFFECDLFNLDIYEREIEKGREKEGEGGGREGETEREKGKNRFLMKNIVNCSLFYKGYKNARNRLARPDFLVLNK